MLYKCEIDVLKSQQLNEAVEFAVLHKCPALVVHQELVPSAIVLRGVRRGKFAIFTFVDCPKGDQFRNDKFRGMQVEAMSADGYEILLTDRVKSDIIDEIKYLSKFHEAFIGKNKIMRFIIGTHLERSEESMASMCEACKSIPLPDAIRTSALTKMPVMKSTLEEHNKAVDFIKSRIGCPVKVSGNINAKTILNCRAERFAVSLEQAQKLVKELQDTAEIAKAAADRGVQNV